MKTFLITMGLVVLVGCSFKPIDRSPKDPYVDRAERIRRCVLELIKKDVKPLDANAICTNIYRGELS